MNIFYIIMNSAGGTHIIVDLYEINYEKLYSINENTYNDFDCFIKKILLESNINLLSQIVHHFDGYPGSFTSLYLLAESHLSIHTWPEYKYIALDVFTCGKCNTQLVVDKIIEYFSAQKTIIKNLSRADYI